MVGALLCVLSWVVCWAFRKSENKAELLLDGLNVQSRGGYSNNSTPKAWRSYSLQAGNEQQLQLYSTPA